MLVHAFAEALNPPRASCENRIDRREVLPRSGHVRSACEIRADAEMPTAMRRIKTGGLFFN